MWKLYKSEKRDEWKRIGNKLLVRNKNEKRYQSDSRLEKVVLWQPKAEKHQNLSEVTHFKIIAPL